MTHISTPTRRVLAPPISFAGMTFHLESVEHRLFPEADSRPACVLPDGTEVRSLERDAALYLLIDHRRDASRTARVEFWRRVSGGELDIAGVYALCDALLIPHA